MVLSNKKLKQKLRQDLVQSISSTASEINLDSVASFQSQSLKERLDSASHKPRLSKREKRRIIDPCVKEKEVENGETSEKTVRKKRKRVESVEDGEEGETTEKKSKKDDSVEDEIGEEGEKIEMKSKKKKKQKKKKKKRKVKKVVEANVEEKVKVEEIQVDTESKEEDGIVPNKVYVGGIPYQSTEDEIRSYFKSCGVITKVDCIMRPEDGAFSGIAFITFETEDGAKRALAFDRAAMGDRYLTIQQYVKTTPTIPRKRTSTGFVPEMVDGYNRVYVGNLAWDTTERDIRKLFSDCVINSVRLGKNKETGEFKGYAHVDFKDSVYVAMALKLDQHVFGGRPVKICCALKERPVGDINTNPTPDETNNVDPMPNGFNDGSYFPATVSSGKVKRRVCYECGEKGHLSTACPKKLQNGVDQANTMVDQETYNTRPAMPSYDHQNNNGYSYMNETYEANYEAVASTGKVKRRSCYECGEKGHLSTACPKKLQNTDHQPVEAEPMQVTSYNYQTNSGYTENYGGSYMDETYSTDPISVGADDGNLASAVSTVKAKRRNCYECGEKGHLSTACPKKQQK